MVFRTPTTVVFFGNWLMRRGVFWTGKEEVKWLEQVVSLLSITATDKDPATDEPLQDAIKLAGEKKRAFKDIVGYHLCS